MLKINNYLSYSEESNKDDTLFQSIVDILANLLPKKWEKVQLLIEIDEGNYQIEFYVKLNGHFINCYDLEKVYDITRSEIRLAFSSIYKLLKTEKANDKWKSLTLTLSPNGKFNINYDFKDHSNDILNFYKEWQIKYLGKEYKKITYSNETRKYDGNEFNYIKPLKDTNLIAEFEKEQDIKFPKDYIDFVKSFNGCTSRVDYVGFYKLFSFNKDDNGNIWNAQGFDTKLKNKLIAFGEDNEFFETLVFDYSKSKNPTISRWDHEKDKLVKICNSFSDLIR